MPRKYLAAVIIGLVAAVLLLFQYTVRNKDYLKRQIAESPGGSFLLNLYKEAASVNLVSIDINKVAYSIFDSKSIPQSESEQERKKLAEIVVIPGIDMASEYRTVEKPAFNTWFRSHGNEYSSKYSVMDKINRDNVRSLEVAWVFHSGEGVWKYNVETNPIFADGKLFITSPAGQIIAVDAATGVEKWRMQLDGEAKRSQEAGRRGLLWWPGNATHKPRIFVPAAAGIYAIDADTGKILRQFGEDGKVGSFSSVAPVIDDNRLIVATSAPSIEAYDIETGATIWRTGLLQSLPLKLSAPNVEPTTPEGVRIGGAVPWAGISLDKARSRVYVSTGNPRPSSYGATRVGRNEFSSSVLSIDTLTGKIDWSFQEVAHDLWDFDVPSPPALVSLTRAGRRIDAVAAVTKIGNTLLLERDSGKPVFDFRLRRAPISEVPGERTWPYQPDIETPEPFGRPGFTLDDITDLSPSQTASVERQLRDASLGFFAPPKINGKAVLFNLHGGAEWPGVAVDQETAILYVPFNRYPWMLHLRYRENVPNPIRTLDKQGDDLYQLKCAKCHGVDRGGFYEREFTGGLMYPSLIGITASMDIRDFNKFNDNHSGLAEEVIVTADQLSIIENYLRAADHMSDDKRSLSIQHAWHLLLDDQGYPGSKPPWGGIAAIDLNSGRKVWEIPFGEFSELTERGIPVTGQPNFGGVMVTKGGLLFATGTIDQKLRAYDSSSGKELWSYKLPASGTAPPSTYEMNGEQYVVVVASGGIFNGFKTHSDAVVAFKLPEVEHGPK